MLPAAMSPPCFATIRATANRKPPSKEAPRQNPTTAITQGFGGKKKDPVWQCIQNCGACCKLDKGPTFPSAEEIFDEPSDIEELGAPSWVVHGPPKTVSYDTECADNLFQLYKSLVGEDGWCIHYDKSSRKCSIYEERPYFCRVEPEIFDALYGIDKKKFNKEACSCCVDTIKVVYGSHSEELEKFNHAIWSTSLT
ncbi:hypothetical protein CASFOL_031833 [Castilleja foliolosa]|uniref:Uncharacterized protein n=1 Tax=Castilleja foliolosa TaxID=1961234 RepID=A0ABD3C0G3_9LAMI